MASHASLASAAELATPILPSGLDVLIVNGAYSTWEAAFLPPSAFASPSQAQALYDDMHASLDTNVLGVVYSINAFIPLVLKGTLKKVVVISTGLADTDVSIPAGGKDGNPIQVTYSSMKAALNMIVAKFAADLKPKDVKLLALSPGVVNTKETPRQYLSFLSSVCVLLSRCWLWMIGYADIYTATEEELAKYKTMFESFQKSYPHWKGPLTPLESVELQMKVIESLTIEDSGKFLSHWGNKTWL
jgi:NAD(P)-dependent dehydrogenase (short-subunit alcohol dehydrogenase family)